MKKILGLAGVLARMPLVVKVLLRSCDHGLIQVIARQPRWFKTLCRGMVLLAIHPATCAKMRAWFG